jgi:hypothetical protein
MPFLKAKYLATQSLDDAYQLGQNGVRPPKNGGPMPPKMQAWAEAFHRRMQAVMVSLSGNGGSSLGAGGVGVQAWGRGRSSEAAFPSKFLYGQACYL